MRPICVGHSKFSARSLDPLQVVDSLYHVAPGPAVTGLSSRSAASSSSSGATPAAAASSQGCAVAAGGVFQGILADCSSSSSACRRRFSKANSEKKKKKKKKREKEENKHLVAKDNNKESPSLSWQFFVRNRYSCLFRLIRSKFHPFAARSCCHSFVAAQMQMHVWVCFSAI
jgi:hypothetical protein